MTGFASRVGGLVGEVLPYGTVAAMGSYALVLGGGSHLGALQAGQLLALCEAGIEVDYIVGCSVGALNGAYMAGGFRAERARSLIDIWREVAADPIFDTGAKRVWSILRQRPSLSRPDKVVSVIDRASPVTRIEELPIELEVVTSNLSRGRVEYRSSGDLRTALAASSAIPGLLPPVAIDGDIHVDGGVLDVLPWRRALVRRPAGTILVLDCHQGRPGGPPKVDSALATLLSSFTLARHHGARDGIAEHPSVIVLPGVSSLGLDTFADSVGALEAAHAAVATFIAEGGLAAPPRRWWQRRHR